MKMRNPWLFCGVAALLFAACDGDSSTSSDDAIDAPDSGETSDDDDPDDTDDDGAASDDDSNDDSSDDSEVDDSGADDSNTDDSEVDDSSVDDSDDGEADDTPPDDTSDAGETDDAPDDQPEAGTGAAEAGVDDAPNDSGASTPDTVVIGEQEGGVGIEVTFSGEGVECGMERCRDATVDSFGIGASGCCFEEEESTCGLNMSTLGLALGLSMPGCEQLDAPGSYDEACTPSQPIPVLLPEAPPEGVVMPGCCLPSGECGFSAQFGDWGFGCVASERFNQDSPGSCEYTP